MGIKSFFGRKPKTTESDCCSIEIVAVEEEPSTPENADPASDSCCATTESKN